MGGSVVRTNQKPGHRLIVDWKDHTSTLADPHKYGGTPSNGTELPLCAGCGKPLHLLFQIDVTDPQLDYLGLNTLGYLYIVTCLDCASYETLTYYRIGERGNEIAVLQGGRGHIVEVRQYPHPLEEHSISLHPLTDDEYPLTENDLFDLLRREGKHQLAGMPLWRQYEEHVPCILCKGRMEYIAMVDSELYIGEDGFREKGRMFGDEGILYTFICRKCSVLAVKAQGL